MLNKIKTIVLDQIKKSKGKNSNRLNLIDSYIQDSPTSKGYPISLNIEPTNYCNLNCIMCPRPKMKREIGMMEFSLFKKIINESKDYVDFVYLHLFGEPLFHKDIFKMIEYAEKSGIKVGLSTNATLLSEANVYNVLNSKLDLLILSLDNPDVRVGSDYNQIEKNIIYLLNELNKVKNKPMVIIQMIDLDRTRKEQNAFKVKFSKYTDVHIKIKDLCIWGGQVDEINKLAERKIIKTPLSNLKCVEPWRALTIYNDGNVVPCCNDFDGSYKLGNLKDTTIKNIWNGLNMQKLRKSFLTGQTRVNLCKFCPGVNLAHEDCYKPYSPFYPFEHEIECYCK